MKCIAIVTILLGTSLCADYLRETMAVCDEATTLTQLQGYSKTHKVSKDSVEMEMWLMSHNCKVIDRKTEIEVLDYTGKKTEILKIKLKKTGAVVYGFNKGIQIEQPGQKNVIMKF